MSQHTNTSFENRPTFDHPLSQHSDTSFEKSLEKGHFLHLQILIKLYRSTGEPGFARLGVDRELGSKVYPSHVPMSQSATRPLGRQLAYQVRAQTLAGSHHIACKLHAITKDYHPPGRHQNCIFGVLQPFRAKTSIFMKNATFTSGAVVVRHLGSLLPGVLWKSWKSKESCFGGTLGVRSPSESVSEVARGALE